MDDEIKKVTPKRKATPKKVEPKPVDYSAFYAENENDILTLAVRLGFMSDGHGLTPIRKKNITDYLLSAKAIVDNKQEK